MPYGTHWWSINLVKVVACCRQETRRSLHLACVNQEPPESQLAPASHYLNQFWPGSKRPSGFIMFSAK